MTTDLEARLRRLEDLEAIRTLKARYLFSCDQKDPEGVRQCFAPGEVEIDFGRIGVFHHRDALVKVFQELGCHEHIVEMHHGVNPQIELLDTHNAEGIWGLKYFLINTRDQQMIQLGAYYEDRYRKIDGEWKIAKTRCVVTSTLIMGLEEGLAKVLFAGRQAPVEVDDPGRQG
ncbi:nuclear transport factor 2 family protein [Halomonas sp. PR-M31]|uniref:nuclear transport factor 2 family protein n=1 Tax=Halomonas sp. PR-M31 TaxID=1471202 RepID=UPI0006517E4B|nr:nuclear transport factor 2 family protein [Halomonas sp. PR-M31]